MMRIEIDQKMMRQIDTLVSSVGILGLFVLISLTFMLGFQGSFIVYTLLPIVGSVMGWKGIYFLYRFRMKGPQVHEMDCPCVECA
ncbi:MAG: hypothetical protein JW839_16630 [Candidatus Lokiarchaeota archaeon]|nr:hypothetical protein [Candidatus Lokiarchaeota archaeon]